jgi:electron transfer flavoprotein beta subunit
MRIVVPVKHVASIDEDADLRGGTVDPADLEWDLNEWDEFSLEAAVQLVEAAGEGEVVVVSVGDDDAEDSLYACLGKGADRAARLWDDALEDADVLVVAQALAAFVRREAPDLVLCGVQSSDGVNGATGVAVAGLLDLPRVAVVKRLTVDGGTAEVERELEGGLVETLRISLPALLTIQTGINEPRYATMRAIRAARAKPLDVLRLSELGIEAPALEAGAVRRALHAPERARQAELLDGSAAEIADRIAEIVKERLVA